MQQAIISRIQQYVGSELHSILPVSSENEFASVSFGTVLFGGAYSDVDQGKPGILYWKPKKVNNGYFTLIDNPKPIEPLIRYKVFFDPSNQSAYYFRLCDNIEEVIQLEIPEVSPHSSTPSLGSVISVNPTQYSAGKGSENIIKEINFVKVPFDNSAGFAIIFQQVILSII